MISIRGTVLINNVLIEMDLTFLAGHLIIFELSWDFIFELVPFLELRLSLIVEFFPQSFFYIFFFFN